MFGWLLKWNPFVGLSHGVIESPGMGAQACSANPTKALEVNGLNTAMIVEAAIANGVRRFIYPSTVHVYSNPIVGNIDEITSTTNLHPYATSKLAGEKVVLYAKKMGIIQGVVLRLSNGSGYSIFPDTKCDSLKISIAEAGT